MEMEGNSRYDVGVILYSPEGRLMQVEYARNVVDQGNTVIGIKATDGILLCVNKKEDSPLLELSSIEKIFQIDEHVAAAASGAMGDACILMEKSRIDAQTSRMRYNEPISIEILGKELCNHMQAFTQYSGLRPFGVGFLLSGITRGEPFLFETDPSGAMLGYKASALGAKRTEVLTILKKHYKVASLEETIPFGLAILNHIGGRDMKLYKVDVGIIKTSNPSFEFLSEKDKDYYFQKTEGIDFHDNSK